MKVIFIVAIAENNAIGKNNRLLWKLSDDMKFFKETTTGHTVVTGRKSYESIPPKFRPLPQRVNIIITRQANYTAPGATVVHSIEQALEKARAAGETECYIIGGGEIYREMLEKNLVDEMLITHVQKTYEADTFFPPADLTKWKSEILASFEAGPNNDAAFTIVKYHK